LSWRLPLPSASARHEERGLATARGPTTRTDALLWAVRLLLALTTSSARVGSLQARAEREKLSRKPPINDVCATPDTVLVVTCKALCPLLHYL